ncbi:MAG: hypothetical protein ACXVXN_02040 [Mycobacteriaceae bacterium]
MTAPEPRDSATHPTTPTPTRSAVLGATEGQETAASCQRWGDESHEPQEVCPFCGRYALTHLPAEAARMSSRFPCVGDTYLSVGKAEPDDPFSMIAECDAGATGDCGFRHVVKEDYGRYGTWDVSITSPEFLELHRQHLAHRNAQEMR